MTKITSTLMGGLGNFLFQIAAGYSLATKHNKQYYIDLKNVQSGHTPIEAYKNNILRNVIFNESDEFKIIYAERSFNYIPIDINPAYSTQLYGYFQSEKYFIENLDKIKELFSIDDFTKGYLHKKYENILKLPLCSIHVRRGDYLDKQNIHPVQSIEYYKESISYFNNMHYLIFSDDIGWCANAFNFIENKTLIQNNKDYEDLYLMSLCNNNIIANSSFSWWGAWLNNHLDKKIIAPKKWFGSDYSANAKDVYCKNWVVI